MRIHKNYCFPFVINDRSVTCRSSATVAEGCYLSPNTLCHDQLVPEQNFTTFYKISNVIRVKVNVGTWLYPYV